MVLLKNAFVNCCLLTLLYVGGLYIWGIDVDRNDGSVIAKRTLSTLCVTGCSIACVLQLSSDFSLFLLNIGFIPLGSSAWATMKGLLLTFTLFLGPLLQPNILQTGPSYLTIILNLFLEWKQSELMDDTKWVLLRNYFISPVTEELVFRASFIAILMQSQFSPWISVILAATIFAFAHLHSLIEQFIVIPLSTALNGFISLTRGKNKRCLINTDHITHMRSLSSSMQAIEGCYADHHNIPTTFIDHMVNSSIQLSYTFVFGIFAGYLFIKTRSAICCIFVHSFCNFIGPPAIDEFMLDLDHMYGSFHKDSISFRTRKMLLAITYVFGLGGFIWLTRIIL